MTDRCFDEGIERRHTASVKWDAQARRFHSDSLTPFWIADMDFAVAPCITKALKERTEHPVYGLFDDAGRIQGIDLCVVSKETSACAFARVDFAGAACGNCPVACDSGRDRAGRCLPGFESGL